MNKRTALITGSTSGIGLAIAKKLASLGNNIILNGFGDANQIEHLVKEISSTYHTEVMYDKADLRNAQEIEVMIGKGVERFGAIDIVVNNAGVQFVSPIENFPIEKWNEIIAVNLSSAFYVMHFVMPSMKAHRFGRIVNIASVHGLVASINKAAYVAAKHGIIGLTKVVALETAEENITCNAICPGWVRTELIEKQIETKSKEFHTTIENAAKKLVEEKQPSKQFVEVEEVANLCAFLVDANNKQITGSAFTIDGGWTAQ